MAALLKGIPVLPVEDFGATLSFYKEKLGFNEAFRDNDEAPGYVGLKRDDVEVHLAKVDGKFARTVGEQTMVRFIVQDVDHLFGEYSKHENVIHPNGKLADKPWGTREFGVLDPTGVCLTFYSDK
ncbi:MAG: VOC family protein [Planctomycetes bacterium]|nr:VOC family protein [Planctomycetota bacterium]